MHTHVAQNNNIYCTNEIKNNIGHYVSNYETKKCYFFLFNLYFFQVLQQNGIKTKSDLQFGAQWVSNTRLVLMFDTVEASFFGYLFEGIKECRTHV